MLDVARGLALCGMVLFHFDWDLAFLHWRETGPASSPAWMAFGHLIAASFLFLSGYGLVLAEAGGWRAAARRLGLIAGVALAITAVTRWLFPQDYIFFGVLHCIAITNLIAMPFLRAPVVVVLATAGLAGIAPLFLSSSRFDGAWWWWLGLSQASPRTLDYRPVLPWLGVVLLGIGMARIWPYLPSWRPKLAVSKATAWAGRHSLFVYLTHQPALLGVLLLVGLVHPPPAVDTAGDFSRQCRAECVAAGAGFEGCKAACECVRAKIGPLIGSTAREPGTPLPLHDGLLEASAACLRAEPSTDRQVGPGTEKNR